MPKKRSKRQPRPTTSEGGGGGDDGTAPPTWASVPGQRLDVDIADDAPVAAAAAAPASDADDGVGDEFDTAKWASKHYDGEDSGGEGDADADLFDPDPGARTNLYDAGSKLDGANDAGMFMSLEVIPGDAYRVERTGDEQSGFVTKVVFNDKEGGRGKKEGQSTGKSEERHARDESKGAGEAEGKALSKKERQKLKRKAKREAAKERKRLKRETEGTEPKAPKKVTASDSLAKAPANEPAATDIDSVEQQQATEQLQTTWSIAAPGVTLHPTLCAGLRSLNYAYPTPIQSATLPAAILGRRDIVGAAPTGSGKTLSYGLPILQFLLDNNDSESEDGGGENQPKQKQSIQQKLPLQALVLTPTRELAMQVTDELKRVSSNAVAIGTIVGGFAEVKQRRTLEKVRPPILVGTPGRLWELMSSNEYTHLNDLSELRFLVIDEADRMIKQGSFPQLKQIFEAINQANPPPEDPDDIEDEIEDDDDDDDRLKGLRGVRGEAKVVMLDDSILTAIERQRTGLTDDEPAPMEMDDDDFEQQQLQLQSVESDDESDEAAEPVHRQTFVYSATLTLPPSMHHLIKKDPSAKKSRRKGKKQPTTTEGEIAQILDAAGAQGETKIVDLSNVVPEGKKKKARSEQEVGDAAKKKGAPEEVSSTATRLPPGLTLGEIRCAQRHKDSHLYAYLVTTRQGSSGPCLVFCNSIAAVRRVGETLKMLGLPVKMLHAQMAQKSRLGALESLRSSNSRSIVVASDVAARGLDISSVTTVIHYDVARAVDTFIHRAGRTARGVGDKAVGTSISLVSPAEEREHQKICEAVRGIGSKSLEQVQVDGRLLSEAQERVALATKIVACNDVESQANKKNKWLQDAAKDAGLEVDEDMLESGLLDGDQRDRQRFLEAKRAKGQLRQLLAKPMRKQNYGKFLSQARFSQLKEEGEVKPFVKALSKSKKRKRPKRT
ncbi:hypothetical protein ACHAXT_007055 [Thalassiosira profunda]